MVSSFAQYSSSCVSLNFYILNILQFAVLYPIVRETNLSLAMNTNPSNITSHAFMNPHISLFMYIFVCEVILYVLIYLLTL